MVLTSFMFRKRIVFSLILLFISTQLYSFFHSIEHDLMRHKHKSVTCTVCLKHSVPKEFLSDFSFLDFDFKLKFFRVRSHFFTSFNTYFYTSLSSRAPPFYII